MKKNTVNSNKEMNKDTKDINRKIGKKERLI